MCRTVLSLLAAALLAWPKDIYADPSKPIRDAMNHPASAFDLYMHTLKIDLQQDFNEERSQAQLGHFIASLIERADLIDATAKDGEEFSAGFVKALKIRPNFYFSDFVYDFQANVFTLRLSFQTPDGFPALETDLSFEGEKERKRFMEEVVIRVPLETRAPPPCFPILRPLPFGAMMRSSDKEAAWISSNGSVAIGAGSLA